MGDDTQIRLWKDAWLDNTPFSQQFPDLFNIVRKKSATVATVLRSVPLNVAFRRSLVGNNLLAWHIQLSDQKDTFRWILQQDGKFTIRSMYRMLAAPDVVPHKHIL